MSIQLTNGLNRCYAWFPCAQRHVTTCLITASPAIARPIRSSATTGETGGKKRRDRPAKRPATPASGKRFHGARPPGSDPTELRSGHPSPATVHGTNSWNPLQHAHRAIAARSGDSAAETEPPPAARPCAASDPRSPYVSLPLRPASDRRPASAKIMSTSRSRLAHASRLLRASRQSNSLRLINVPDQIKLKRAVQSFHTIE
jgi:hypothetical protein